MNVHLKKFGQYDLVNCHLAGLLVYSKNNPFRTKCLREIFQVCGLCGNFNDDGSDDNQMPGELFENPATI